MKVSDLALEGVKLIEPALYADSRGFFVERYNEARFGSHGLPTRFFQDNHSRSMPGVLRGLHFQSRPPQGKLVGVIRGRIWDVVVDIRPRSTTYGRHLGVELSADTGASLWIPAGVGPPADPGASLWIPAGFAHGFFVLGTEPADVLYKADSAYDPSSEGGIL